MSQATMFLGNVDFPAARIVLNENFEALATLSSGATAPATTFSGMLWHDTTANVLKLRNDSDTAWISLFAIDQGGGLAKPSTPDVLDEDDFASNSATRPPSQQSAKAYVDAGSKIKAWVNFDGTGTVAIRDSFNVSSITDNGTGNYTVNFTTAMVDTNYCVIGGTLADGAFGRGGVFVGPQSFSDISTGSVVIKSFLGSSGSNDSAAIDRDLINVTVTR